MKTQIFSSFKIRMSSMVGAGKTVDNHFKKGNIYRIYIKDFLTLDEVEVRPKPFLNIVCGPNGTGKSSILCAICLCLGGKPVVTGRGKEIAEFVKHGKNTSILEVELFMGDQVENVVVGRRFDRTNKSHWSLQGRDVNKKVVEKKLSELQIQMDNLCHFLPQDRVSSFAKMNTKELLDATERAVGDPSLAEQHLILCASGDHLQSLNSRVKSLEEELSRAVTRNAQLKDAVTNHEMKIKLEESIKKLQTQKLWFFYDLKRKLHSQMKENWDKSFRELKGMQKTLAPVEEKLKMLQNMGKELKSLIRQMSGEIKKRQGMAHSLQKQYEHHEEMIGDFQRELNGKRQEEQRRQREFGDMQKQLNVLQAQLSNMPHIEGADHLGNHESQIVFL
ncbi:hypothetical protein Pcinc_033801 [Petrolisthes cinctipes]|uniref:Structural maintenance of chromosomes protein 5 n=1 Tax=Petrolisthes cinctipes TaxID=88211 RepID=A0AAE1ERP2_PETCI|nr:hypothetical protein Pcinc_033801 [Petrolisthes cinctipes]